MAIPTNPQQRPDPYFVFLLFAARHEGHYRLFQRVAQMLESGHCCSLRAVFEMMEDTLGNHHSLTSVLQVHNNLAEVTELAFGKFVDPYHRTRPYGGQVIGLSADGKQMFEYITRALIELDRIRTLSCESARVF